MIISKPPTSKTGSTSREMAMNFNFINTWLTCISVGAERNVGKALVVDAEEEKEEETE